MYYGILGSGKCGENIIEDGLKEIGVENNVFLIALRKGATDNEDRVYDFLMENEADFHAFCGSNAPQIIKDSASRVHDISDAQWLYPAILQELKDHKGELLLMWNDDTAEFLTQICFEAADLGITVRELTNGLIPINMVTPTEKPDAPETSEANVEPFTEDELRSMSIGVLRKAAAARGVEGVGAYSKDELLSLLIDNKTHIEKLEDNVTYTNVSTTNNVVTTTVPTSVKRDVIVAPDGDCMVTVVMPNGTVISTPATMSEVRMILGLG